MNEISLEELGKQLRKPAGENGLKVGEGMNVSNETLYDQVLSFMELDRYDKILELGFGNGNFFRKYFEKEQNIHIWGVDYSEDMVTDAAGRNSELIGKSLLDLRCEDSLYLNFRDEYFNKIVGINTVYFWNPIDKQVEEIRRVLKKGGKLFIGFRPRRMMVNLPFVKDGFTLYEPDELMDIFIRHQFKLIKQDTRSYMREAIDKSMYESIDICMVLEKQ